MGLRRLRLAFRTFTYDDWLLACFMLGVFAGTGAALAFGRACGSGGILGAAGTGRSGA